MNIQNLTSEEQIFIGEPADLGYCKTYPIKLKEIAKMGTKKFYECLNIFTLKTEDIKEFLISNGIANDIGTLQFHLINANTSDSYLETLNQAFQVFLHESNITCTKEAIVLGDISENRIIKQEEFDDICQLVEKQTSLPSGDENEDIPPEGTKEREIWEALHKGKQQLLKAKSVNGEGGLTFLDLVASLAARGNGLNAINIWDMTYYAFQDQFQRMQWIDNYENTLQSLMHGADSKKVTLENWLQPIKNKDKK